MNVLVIANVTEAGGWGTAAREYIRALSTTDLNITVRPLFLGGAIKEISPDIRELIDKKSDTYDLVLLNTLPSFFEYDKRFGKHVGLVHLESRYWQNDWPRRCHLMDSMIVPSKFSFDCLYQTTKIIPEVINIPCDITKYRNKYPQLPPDITNGKYNFYFIGEFIERKNLDLLLRAFHTEFEKHEAVNLIIKTSRSGIHPKALTQHISNHISELKKNLRLYKTESDYHNEILITDHLTDEEIYGIHQSCQCFVMPSSGESWVLPAADAIGFGNRVIISETGLYHDCTTPVFLESKFANNQYQVLPVRGRLDYIFTKDSSLPDLFTAKEQWLYPDVHELRRVMRNAFEHGNLKFSGDVVKQWSYENIGKKLKDLFCQLL